VPLVFKPSITLLTSVAASTRTRVQQRLLPAALSSRREAGKHLIERRLVVERSRSTRVERTVRQELAPQRIATTTTQRHDHFQRVESPIAYRRVVQTLVPIQPSAAARVEPTVPPPMIPARLRFDRLPGPRGSAPPPQIAADDLRRVTDHVIAVLDHRVLSYRERTGR
jgi:hypothetical protein